MCINYFMIDYLHITNEHLKKIIKLYDVDITHRHSSLYHIVSILNEKIEEDGHSVKFSWKNNDALYMIAKDSNEMSFFILKTC